MPRGYLILPEMHGMQGLLAKEKPRRISVGQWLRHKDSNPDKLIQSQSCYRYTMSQGALIIITVFFNMSRDLFDFLLKIIYTIFVISKTILIPR